MMPRSAACASRKRKSIDWAFSELRAFGAQLSNHSEQGEELELSTGCLPFGLQDALKLWVELRFNPEGGVEFDVLLVQVEMLHLKAFRAVSDTLSPPFLRHGE